MPIGLGKIAEFVSRKVHAPCSDFVKQRLPQMGTRLLDKCYIGAAPTTEAVAETGDELKPTSPTANDDDAVEAAAPSTRRPELAGHLIRRGCPRSLLHEIKGWMMRCQRDLPLAVEYAAYMTTT